MSLAASCVKFKSNNLSWAKLCERIMSFRLTSPRGLIEELYRLKGVAGHTSKMGKLKANSKLVMKCWFPMFGIFKCLQKIKILEDPKESSSGI